MNFVDDQIARCLLSDDPIGYILDLEKLIIDSPVFVERRMEFCFLCKEISDAVIKVLQKQVDS